MTRPIALPELSVCVMGVCPARGRVLVITGAAGMTGVAAVVNVPVPGADRPPTSLKARICTEYCVLGERPVKVCGPPSGPVALSAITLFGSNVAPGDTRK